MQPGIHPQEPDRLAALHALHIVDQGPIAELDAAARIAAAIADVPFGSINMIDRDRHYTAASHGSPVMHAPRHLSLCAMAILEGGLVYTEDAQADSRFVDKPVMKMIDPPIRLFAAAPINTDDGLPIGTVRVYGDKPAEISESQKAALTDLASQVMRFLELRKASLSLRHYALHDDLTGVANRRALIADIPDELTADATVFYLDLNDFKIVNDELGHPAGDAVLRAVARRITGVARAEDLVVRMGGDEFLMWCRGRVDEGEQRAAIQDAIAEPIWHGPHRLRVQASIGSVFANAGAGRDAVIRAADAQMYQQKARHSTQILRD